MSAEKPRRTVGADLYNGTTIDQIIAQKIGQDNLMPSLQLALEDPGANSSNCGEGYSCAYTNSISWSTPTRPLPMELNPQVVFERMFGDGSTAEERVLRRSQNRSLLDSLTNNLARFRGRLGPADRSRLDEYAEDIREIERRLQIAMKASAAAPENTTVPVGVPESFDEHVKLQSDLLALAFRADITRVATMLFARDLTTRSYPESGTTVAFHAGSHHGEDPKRKAVMAQVNRYHVSMLAYLVDKLAKTADGDGTLLDHSLILYGSNMGNSNQHSHEDVAARARRRSEREAQGWASPGVSDQDRADRESAAERARHVRHSPGQHRRQHGSAGSFVGEDDCLQEVERHGYETPRRKLCRGAGAGRGQPECRSAAMWPTRPWPETRPRCERFWPSMRT